MLEEALAIGELAERTGTTVRNIRYYTQLGVLPRPDVRGRRGFYGARHVERLALVRRLQERGYSLAAIADMVDDQVPVVLSGEVVADPATAAWDGGDPHRVTRAQLAQMVPALADDPALVDRMVELDLVVPDGGDGFRVPQPALLRAGIGLVARGVPVPVVLGELVRLREELAVLADRFAGIVERDVLPARGGRADADAAADALEHVWPSVLVAVGRVLTDAMHAAVAARLGERPQP